MRERGKVSDAMINTFLAADWQLQQVLEVILGVSIKAMSNYTNSIVSIPLDGIVANEI